MICLPFFHRWTPWQIGETRRCSVFALFTARQTMRVQKYRRRVCERCGKVDCRLIEQRVEVMP